MKQWKKTVGIVVAALAIFVAVILSFGNETECCLCNAHTSSAPHLIDLQTGDMLSLTVDGPTSGPEELTDVSTFSFIRFHTVTGTKQTAPNVIELKIPADDTVNTPALCNKCRKLLPQGYDGRYALANLTQKELFTVTAESEISVCGYTVRVAQEETHLSVLIADSHQ